MDLVRKIDDLGARIDGRLKSHDEEISNIKISLGKKVDWKWFFTAILSLFGILVVLLGTMWAEIKGIAEVTRQTEKSVSNIEGKLEPFDFVND